VLLPFVQLKALEVRQGQIGQTFEKGPVFGDQDALGGKKNQV